MRAARPALTEGPIAPTLLKFALPVLGTNVLQSLNGSVNSFWIGHYLGESALAASSNANLILFVLLALVFGISMATSILVGQTYGQHNLPRMKQVIGSGAVFFVLLSVGVALLGHACTPMLLRWLATPAAALPLASAYLGVIFLAVPAMYFYNFVMMALRGSGDATTPFYFMLASVGLDILLNPLLMFGGLGLPALGIAGSAWATLVAQSVTLLALLVWLYVRGHMVCLRGAELHYLRPRLALIRLLLVKGIPMGLQMLIVSTSGLLLIRLVNAHGTVITAAYGVAAQLWGYVQMPALAISMSVSAMAAQNIGAHRWDRVGQVTRWGLIYNVLLTGALVAVILLLERWVFGLFLPAGSAALPVAIAINQQVAWTFVLFGLTTVLVGTIRASGAVWAPLGIIFVSLWLLRVPFADLGQRWLGLQAIWWSFAVGSLIALLLSGAYYRWGHWRGHTLLPDPPAAPSASPVDAPH